MGVRLFDWSDLPTLNQYKKEGVFLDSALLLTRGQLLVPGVLFSYLAPSMGVYTCISEGSEHSSNAMGQFIHPSGSPLCHLTFLSPDEGLENGLACTLVEFMMTLSGKRGALRVLADVDERTSTFEALRKCGFAIYTRQRIWKVTAEKKNVAKNSNWHVATDRDGIPVRTLYNNLVPGMVQQIEPFPTLRPHGMVCYHQGELIGYVEIKNGHRGIWAQPFFHPDAQDSAGILAGFLGLIASRWFRPIYICIRSYQSWLEPAIEEIGAIVSPRQAVMVRQLVVQQKVVRQFAIPNLDSGQTEMTAPIAHLEK
jgi:hypothetical protein